MLGGDKGKLSGRESKVNSCAKGTESMMFFFKEGGHFSKDVKRNRQTTDGERNKARPHRAQLAILIFGPYKEHSETSSRV